MGTAVHGTDTIGEFGGREQAVGFHDLALAVEPLGLDRVEPGALDRQVAHDQADAFARELYLPVGRADPGADDLAVVPARGIPDQQDIALAPAQGRGRAPGTRVDGESE